MNAFRKYIGLLLVAAVIISSLLCFSGCGKEEAALDFGSFDRLEIDGYYLKALNSVEGDGVVLETNYLVCSDEELANTVGNLTARFDEDGALKGYDAVIAQSEGQRVISFSKSRETSSYTDSLYAADYSAILSTIWESIAIRWDSKERFRSVGTVTYFPNGVEKTYSEHQYLIQNGKEYLSCTIDRVRAEDGSLTSEKINNYDENGKAEE